MKTPRLANCKLNRRANRGVFAALLWISMCSWHSNTLAEDRYHILRYTNDHKWLEDNAKMPLRGLISDVKQGYHTFKVQLPEQNRPLSMERLIIIRDTLAHETNYGIVFTEDDILSTVDANTIAVKPTR